METIKPKYIWNQELLLLSVSKTYLQSKKSYGPKNSKNFCCYHAPRHLLAAQIKKTQRVWFFYSLRFYNTQLKNTSLFYTKTIVAGNIERYNNLADLKKTNLFYLSEFFIILQEESKILVSNVHCHISAIFSVIFHSITTARKGILIYL